MGTFGISSTRASGWGLTPIVQLVSSPWARISRSFRLDSRTGRLGRGGRDLVFQNSSTDPRQGVPIEAKVLAIKRLIPLQSFSSWGDGPKIPQGGSLKIPSPKHRVLEYFGNISSYVFPIEMPSKTKLFRMLFYIDLASQIGSRHTADPLLDRNKLKKLQLKFDLQRPLGATSREAVKDKVVAKHVFFRVTASDC